VVDLLPRYKGTVIELAPFTSERYQDPAARQFCVVGKFMYAVVGKAICVFNIQTGELVSCEEQFDFDLPRHLYYSQAHNRIYGYGACGGFLAYTLSSASSNSFFVLGKPRMFGQQHLQSTTAMACDDDFIYGNNSYAYGRSKIAVFTRDFAFARYYQAPLFSVPDLKRMFFLGSFLGGLCSEDPGRICLLFNREKNQKPLYEKGRTYPFNPLNTRLISGTPLSGSFRDVACFDSVLYVLCVSVVQLTTTDCLTTVRVDYYLAG
jgi:hypothetical protein